MFDSADPCREILISPQFRYCLAARRSINSINRQAKLNAHADNDRLRLARVLVT